MDIIVNSIAILVALIIGIFIGSKTDAKNAIYETFSKSAKKVKNLIPSKTQIISPSELQKKRVLLEALPAEEEKL